MDIVIQVLVYIFDVCLHIHALIQMFDADLHFLNGII